MEKTTKYKKQDLKFCFPYSEDNDKWLKTYYDLGFVILKDVID